MERNYQNTASIIVDPDELDWRTAFHEAGHATAIHIGNQQKNLPPVFFEIQIIKPKTPGEHFFAKVVDGALIQNLPIALVESLSLIADNHQLHSFQRAYEADVVNLLAGPLAEAKYVSVRDDKPFNLSDINIVALESYGGLNDLEKANSYLDSFIAAKTRREERLLVLLKLAFDFINARRNWRCILNLAHYILDSHQEIIACDEAISVIDRSRYMHPHKLAIRL